MAEVGSDMHIQRFMGNVGLIPARVLTRIC